MSDAPKAEVFEKIYQDYLNQVAQVDLRSVQDRLGVEVDGEDVIIPFLGTPHRVNAQGVADDRGRRPSHAVSVVLCKYLLLCPNYEPQGSEWVTYKDFKDAAPFAVGFLNNAERPIAQVFPGRLEELKKACLAMNGAPGDLEISCDLIIRFEALPKIPIILLFNDEDEDFPAHCSFLFEARAEKFLDMECLAIIAWALSNRLKQFVSADDGSALM